VAPRPVLCSCRQFHIWTCCRDELQRRSSAQVDVLQDSQTASWLVHSSQQMSVTQRQFGRLWRRHYHLLHLVSDKNWTSLDRTHQVLVDLARCWLLHYLVLHTSLLICCCKVRALCDDAVHFISLFVSSFVCRLCRVAATIKGVPYVTSREKLHPMKFMVVAGAYSWRPSTRHTCWITVASIVYSLILLITSLFFTTTCM